MWQFGECFWAVYEFSLIVGTHYVDPYYFKNSVGECGAFASLWLSFASQLSQN